MMGALPAVSSVSMLHLVFLALWGGVVATEAVLELYPLCRPELLSHSVRYHFWIDLLVELPLLAGVAATGTVLVALTWPIPCLAAPKILCGGWAVTANAICIVLVVRRKRRLDSGATEEDLRGMTRRILILAAAALPFAVAAAALGFWLGYHRLLKLIG